MEMYSQKLDKSSWEQRINALSGHVLKVMFVGLVVWGLLNLDSLIPVFLGH